MTLEQPVEGIRRVDIGGGRCLAVLIQGKGPVVVLETGGGGGGLPKQSPGKAPLSSWNGVENRLAEFATVISYNRAGFAPSDPALEKYPMPADRARDLLALLNALKIDQPVLLAGWSLGGLYALHFAALNPGRVAGLLLIDPTDLRGTRHYPLWLRLRSRVAMAMVITFYLGFLYPTGLLRTAWGQGLLLNMLRKGMSPRTSDEKLREMVSEMVRPKPGPRENGMKLEASKLLRCCAQTESLLAQHALPQVPLIVLSAGWHGSDVTPAIKQELRRGHRLMADLVPGGEQRVLSDDVGHQVPLDDPEAIVQGVRDLIRGASSARSA